LTYLNRFFYWVFMARSVLTSKADQLTLGHIMKLASVGTAVCLGASTLGAWAQTAAPAPGGSLSFNAAVVTDYRYRGISQSGKKPALQGGVDYSHPNGFYAGAWGSSIDWIRDDAAVFGLKPGASSSGNTWLELDAYAGYKGSLGAASYDIGVLQYIFPGNHYANIVGSVNANTTEAYGALTVGPVTAKYSHSLSDIFGFANSQGSAYLDLSANFDLGQGWSLSPHWGHQKINNTPQASYTDYALTLGKDFGGNVSGSLAYSSTNNKTYLTSKGQIKSGAGWVLGVKYSF
jgi:uncharacterized protein (TIGR02001 family)